MENLPAPAWAIALLAVTVPPALYSLLTFVLNKSLGFIGTDKAEDLLTILTEAIADGVVTEDEVKALVERARQKETE